jgi:hypothetical protein
MPAPKPPRPRSRRPAGGVRRSGPAPGGLAKPATGHGLRDPSA